MAEDYGHFADGSSAAFGCGVIFRARSDSAIKATQGKKCLRGFLSLARRRGLRSISCSNQLTPSFFCRLEDDVVYWNTSRLSG
jgi:hypothetical protein